MSIDLSQAGSGNGASGRANRAAAAMPLPRAAMTIPVSAWMSVTTAAGPSATTARGAALVQSVKEKRCASRREFLLQHARRKGTRSSSGAVTPMRYGRAGPASTSMLLTSSPPT